jgi:hypothetical protein
MVLIGYWPLNEQSGNTAYDHSGNEYHGSINGAGPVDTGTVNGPLGQKAFDFDGSDDYVGVADIESVISGSTEISMGAWIYAESNNDFSRVWASDNNNFECWVADNNNLKTRITLGGTNVDIAYSSFSFNTWYHVVRTWDGNTHRMFIDGRVVGETTQSGDIDNLGNFFRIGQRKNSTEYWDGFISELRLYNRPLTKSEVDYIHSVGSRGRQVTLRKSS